MPIRTLQRFGQRLFLAVEGLFDRAFGSRLNPLYHLGAISYWMFWLIVATGFYLYAFYRTGVDTTYASVQALSDSPWRVGGIMRSVHRYASDAMVVTMLLHLLRHFVFGNFRGFRAFSWVSGVVLLWLAYASGVNGFMLPWDRLAQFTATRTAEWLDALPVFRGALVRNFVLAENISDRFFSLLSFLHIGMPLAMLAGLWIHTQRVPAARVMPPRPIAIGTLLALVALALVLPIGGQGPADLGSEAARLSIDWFYLGALALLSNWSPIHLWWAVGAATALIFVLPWLPPRERMATGPHRVTYYPIGTTVLARPGETLLDAGLREGLALPFECRNGGCGVCRASVVAGEVAYGPVQPSALARADRARGVVLMCRASPTSDVSIEVERIDREQLALPVYRASIVSMEHLTHDVIGLVLGIEDGRQIHYLAGQYLNIVLEDGERRSYSFTHASGSTDRIELHIRHVPGGLFTDRLFSDLRVGDSLQIEGPMGEFVLREPSERPLIFVAGATGAAPVRSLLEEAFARGITRPLHFYWGVRKRRDLYRCDELEAWAREHPNFHFVPVLSAAGPDDAWAGRTGLVHEAILADFPDLAGHLVYACGSVRMIAAARPAFIAQGLDENACLSDAFAGTATVAVQPAGGD
ncbi:MAG: cytochrome b N-terminal domain-containing protein [Burkholderiaceae bacterium]|nr:cytochrome b N-terminal domain-containing protein [Burkholderiaceae bacterium]